MRSIKDKVRDRVLIVLKTASDVLRGPVWRMIKDARGAIEEFVKRLLGGTRSRRMLFRSIQKSVVKVVERNKEDIATDFHRRAFLKYAVFGSIVFLVGKYAGPFANLLRGETVLSEKTFENFNITETGRKLLVTDDDGEEILTIDKEGF